MTILLLLLLLLLYACSYRSQLVVLILSNGTLLSNKSDSIKEYTQTIDNYIPTVGVSK